jgi:hypothetical protein
MKRSNDIKGIIFIFFHFFRYEFDVILEPFQNAYSDSAINQNCV